MFKKMKIRAYLNKKENSKSPFGLLLSDYLNGRLKMELSGLGLRRINVHIDWTDDVKCIGVQAKYQAYRIDMQIYPDEFSFAYDSDEPDNFSSYPLNGREQVYTTVQSIIKMIHLKFS